MDVSKFEINKKVCRYSPSLQERILLWMQKNPRLCKNTNDVLLGNSSADSLHNTPGTISQVVGMMRRNDMLFTSGNKRHKTYRINYHHSNIPQSVIDNMSDEDKKYYKRTLQLMEQKLNKVEKDDKGAYITQPRIKESEQNAEVEPVEENKQTENIPMQVECNKETGKLKISITINLNL